MDILKQDIIYIAHRLFAAHDRLLAANLAYFLTKQSSDFRIFLPFCDTSEDAVVHPQKGRFLYEQDCKRLRNLKAIICFLHGPIYDEGTCMELGFAYALGTPVISVTTDFISYGYVADKASFHLADPLLEIMSDQILHFGELPEMAGGIQNIYEAFACRNQAAIDHIYKQILECLYTLPGKRAFISNQTERLVYIDFCGGEYSFFDSLIEQAVHNLKSRGFSTYVARRFRPDNSRSVRDCAEEDLQAATRATAYVLSGNGGETPAGTAALLGFANALGRPAYLHFSGRQLTYATGREPNRRNLMILYGATRILSDLSSLEEVIP